MVRPPSDAAPTQQPSAGLISGLKGEIGYLAQDTKGVLRSLSGALTGKTQAAPKSGEQAGTAQAAPSSRTPTRMIEQAPKPKRIGEQIGDYVILNAWPLARSNYYQVRQMRCAQGHNNPGGNSGTRCATCQGELLVLLAHESNFDNSQTDQDRHQDLVQLSHSAAPGFLKHISIFPQGGRLYVISEHPSETWLSLAQVNLPVWDHASLIQWCLSLGEALQVLAQGGFAPQISSPIQVLETVIAIGSGRASFTDLTFFRRVRDEMGADGSYHSAVVAYLIQLIYILTSGKPQSLDRAPRDLSDVPPPFRGILNHVLLAGNISLEGLLEMLRGALVVPESRRSLRQIAGYRTDVGRTRGHNEDFVGKYSLGMQQTSDMPEVGLYLVADGMGGHQAGEVASQDVVRVILDDIQGKVQDLQSAPKVQRSTVKLDQVDSAGEVLRHAITRANEVLFNARQQVGSDRGTTITAALIVGPLCAVANVGDSRTYLLRANQLIQLTQDHSLVASLLAANVIQPDEVRVHPQRSRIFRNLGQRSQVQVDIFEVQLQAKDRLLLCSDGLWEMVLDPEIQQILSTAADPQETCDRLVDAANLAGGQDNISVVCVWMT
jgi:serine/threonine protein phosphatase PrpC